MYKLTLTYAERRAIDWIGHRYANGDDLYYLLWCGAGVTCEPDDADWCSPVDITFSVPERIAWCIHDLCGQEDGLWPCFAPELAQKMDDFLANVV